MTWVTETNSTCSLLHVGKCSPSPALCHEHQRPVAK